MKLLIPENVTLRWELIRGIGKRELLECLAVLIPALLLALVLGQVMTAPTAPLLLICGYVVLLFACYLFFARIEQYQSLYLFIKRRVQFGREQQAFIYERRKEVLIYEGAEEARPEGPGLYEH